MALGEIPAGASVTAPTRVRHGATLDPFGVPVGNEFQPGLEFRGSSGMGSGAQTPKPAEALLLSRISGAAQGEASGSPGQSRALGLLCPLRELRPFGLTGRRERMREWKRFQSSAIQGMFGLCVWRSCTSRVGISGALSLGIQESPPPAAPARERCRKILWECRAGSAGAGKRS